jgi:hypothetical protein
MQHYQLSKQMVHIVTARRYRVLILPCIERIIKASYYYECINDRLHSSVSLILDMTGLSQMYSVLGTLRPPSREQNTYYRHGNTCNTVLITVTHLMSEMLSWNVAEHKKRKCYIYDRVPCGMWGLSTDKLYVVIGTWRRCTALLCLIRGFQLLPPLNTGYST